MKRNQLDPVSKQQEMVTITPSQPFVVRAGGSLGWKHCCTQGTTVSEPKKRKEYVRVTREKQWSGEAQARTFCPTKQRPLQIPSAPWPSWRVPAKTPGKGDTSLPRRTHRSSDWRMNIAEGVARPTGDEVRVRFTVTVTWLRDDHFRE